MAVTMLQFVSDVLMKIGEEAVDTVERNAASRLAARNTLVAIRALADEFSYWPWMASEYTAESWLGHIATLPSSLLSISYIVDRGSGLTLRYVSDELFHRHHYNNMATYEGSYGGARFYTYRNNKVLFSPYPITEEARNNIVFNAALLPSGIGVDSEVLPIALRDTNCLLFRVCMMMAVDHLKDADLAQLYALEYDRALRASKQRMVTDLRDKRNSMIW